MTAGKKSSGTDGEKTQEGINGRVGGEYVGVEKEKKKMLLASVEQQADTG